jgi:DNA-binding CsgD family transcriptional regulator
MVGGAPLPRGEGVGTGTAAGPEREPLDGPKGALAASGVVTRASPPTTEELLDVLSDFLIAVQEPGLWPAALSRLAFCLGCQQLMLLRGGGARRAVLATNNLDPEEIRRLAGRRSDPDATWPACPPEHREFALPGEGRLSLLLDRADLDPETLKLIERLAPFLARAWRLTDALAASERRQSWSSRVLEPLATGILILGREGLVLQKNAAAHRKLASQSELRIEEGRLRGANSALDRSLAALLASDPQFDERRVATESMLISRSGPNASRESDPLEALVIASPRFADALPTAIAVILLFDPRADGENPAVALATRYDLSFEQTQVVGHLLRGRSIPEVARELGVPPPVVSACLGGIYQQVGTTRQVELVKLLLAGPGRPPGS